MYEESTVGVVVPAYNEAGFVGDVLDSIPSFVDRAYVVDDCSTDGTWAEICDHVEDTTAVLVDTTDDGDFVAVEADPEDVGGDGVDPLAARPAEAVSLSADSGGGRRGEPDAPDGESAPRGRHGDPGVSGGRRPDGGERVLDTATEPTSGEGSTADAREHRQATGSASETTERHQVTDSELRVTERSAADDRSGATRIRPIRLATNHGRGGAVKVGYWFALQEGMDVVAVMDGDGQMDGAILDRILDPVVEGRADYAKGNRLVDSDHWGEMSRWRLFGNGLLTLLTKLASGYWHVRDPQNGYTAISADALDALELDALYEDYGFLNDLLIRLNVRGMDVADVPMEARYADEESGIAYSSFVPRLSALLLVGFCWRVHRTYLSSGETDGAD